MAGMILLGKKIAGVVAHGALKNGGSGSSYIVASVFRFGKRNLSSSDGSDGRYVSTAGNVFVEEGNQEGGQAWPPPTQGGFVAESFPGQEHGPPPVPPTQGGFVEHQNAPGDGYVPVTQEGFVENTTDYRSTAGVQPNVDYSGYQTQQGFAGNAYTQGNYPEYLPSQMSNAYIPPPPAAPVPPVPPVAYPPNPGQYVSDNPWISGHYAHTGMYQVPPSAQVPYVYNVQQPISPPIQDQSGYMYQQQQLPPDYTYAQPNPQPAATAASWPSAQNAGYPNNFVQAPPGQEGYQQHLQQQQQNWNQEQQWVQQPQSAPYVQNPQPAAASNEATDVPAEVKVATNGAGQPVADALHSESEISSTNMAAVHEVSQEVSESSDRVDDSPVHEHETSAAEEVQTKEPEGLASQAEVGNEGRESSADHDHSDIEEASEQQEYDATAAAMAEAGVSSENASEDAEDKVEEPVEAQPPEEPVKGLESLLEVETSKPPPAPPASQNESFLDLLSKTNLTRQPRPRPQLSFRPQRKTYARLHNLPRQILKSDIVNYFSEVNLQKENIHITYDEKFYPVYAQVAFDSTEALRNAQKILQTKGRFGGRIVRMEPFLQFIPPGHPQISETMKNYLGRMLLMLHLPPEGRVEDIEKFFDGYGYDPSALTMLDTINMTLARFPQEGNRPVRRAAIGFFSSLEAMRALREKQGDFVLNEPVELRLIQ